MSCGLPPTLLCVAALPLLPLQAGLLASATSGGSPNAGGHFAPGFNGLASQPPLGWRSWNAFGGLQNKQPGVSPAVITETIDAITKQRPNPHAASDGRPTISLCDAGFCSVGIDEGWEQCTLPHEGNITVCERLGEPVSNCDGNSYCCPGMPGDCPDGTNACHDCTQHNAAGDPMINPLFGGFAGMKSLVEYGHSKNVSMGWYMAGCKCWDRDTRALTVARDVAALVELGFDGVKFDACAPGSQNLSRVAELLQARGKSLMTEQCHWGGGPDVDSNTGEIINCPFNFYRSSGDIIATFASVVTNLQSVIGIPSRPHCWAYPDMLEVGNLASFEEDRSHYAMWSIVSSPLTLGMDLRNDTKVNALLPILVNPEILAVNQVWAGHAGFLVQSSAATTNMSFVEAVPCNATAPSQKGWELRQVAGADSSSAAFHIVADGQCADFEGGGRLAPCNNSAPGQLFLHNPNNTLTQVTSGNCLDIAAKVGPEIELRSCNDGLNQRFEFEENGLWKEKGGHQPECKYPPCIFPERCMQRRKGNPRHDAASDIYFQIWAKPQQNQAMAVLVFNNNAGSSFTARIEFSAVQGMDANASYKVRDLYKRTDLTLAANGSFVTDVIAKHDSRLLLFTPRTARMGHKGNDLATAAAAVAAGRQEIVT